MARRDSNRKQETEKPAPRLYLLLALPEDGADFSDAVGDLAQRLLSAGEEADIAAVLIRSAHQAPVSLANRLAPLIRTAQDLGAACLIEGNVALASAAGADGAHLQGPEALKAALPSLRPDGIAGSGGLRTRHEAMTVAENGADYVMFGEPDGGGRRPAFETTLERVEWWSQLFEIPCAGHAISLEEVDALVAGGADFIAVDSLLLDAPKEGARALAARLAVTGDA